MTLQLRIFAIAASIVILVVIVDLVRRKKLREEYTWLWVLAGACIFLLSLSYDFMLFVGGLFGDILPSTILYLFAILFLVLLNLYFSVRISGLHKQLKDLAQELALLRNELKK
jgi:ABC-type Co2+ transport system permease subunit